MEPADDFVAYETVGFKADDALVFQPAEVGAEQAPAGVDVTSFQWAEHSHHTFHIRSVGAGQFPTRAGMSTSQCQSTTSGYGGKDVPLTDARRSHLSQRKTPYYLWWAIPAHRAWESLSMLSSSPPRQRATRQCLSCGLFFGYLLRRRLWLCSSAVAVSLCLLAGAAWAAGDAQADGLVFTGRYRLKLQSTALVGAAGRFRFDTGIAPGTRFTQNLALAGFGRLDGGWYFQGNYDDTLPVPERLELRIRRAEDELFAGTRRFMAGGDGLLHWGRLLTGLQGVLATGEKQEVRISGAIGEPLGLPAREVLPGRGLVGPYLLNQLHLPVVAGSEAVRVDDRLLQRGIDYTIDYELGGITFREPVLETSQIEVEYEYVAPQARRAAMGALSLRSGPLALHLLAGAERSLKEEPDNPLEFLPPGGAEEEELPTEQGMYGTALTWQVAPGAYASSSWLATQSGEEGGASKAAWQLGGEWGGEWGRIGLDYRVIEKGFRPLGRSADDTDYRLLTGGFERPVGPWHSKLNVVWRRSPSQGEPLESRYQAEHVLSYVTEQGLLGWSLGVEGGRQGAKERQVLTSGVLGGIGLGPWQLEAERRGIVGRLGAVVAGEPLSASRLAARLADHPRLTASLQWQHDCNAAGGSIADEATVWRVTAGSRSSKEESAVSSQGAGEANWRVQWLQSEMVRRGLQVPSRVTYARAEGGTPLLAEGLSGTLLFETKSRTAYSGDVRADDSLQAGLHYEHGVGLHLSAAESRSQATWQGVTAEKGQAARSAEVVVPLPGAWTYRAAVHGFTELSSGSWARGVQQVHAVAWDLADWQVTADFTAGLLRQPATAAEDDDEDTPPLSALPLGRRLALSGERATSSGQLSARLAREWEQSAATWRGELRGSVKTRQVDLVASYASEERREEGRACLRQLGKIAAQRWWGERTLLSLSGRSDLYQEASGKESYRAISVLGEWTTYF